MKKRTKEKLKSITADILEELYYALEAIGAASLNKKEAYRILYGRNQRFSDLTETMLGRWIEHLRCRNYLKIKQTPSGNKSIEFTNKGRLKIVDSITEGLAPDYIFRFVSFDIPEEMRKARNSFRRAIKRMGFIQIQQSLWVINKNVAGLVEMAAYEYKVEKYIVYIVSERSDIDGILIKRFG